MSQPAIEQVLHELMQQMEAMKNENEQLRQSIHENHERSGMKFAALETVLQGKSQSNPAADIPVPPIGTQYRPRPRLPDPALFEGTKSLWRGWKLEMENKLQEDAEALGTPTAQLRYIFSRLTGKAKENVTTYVEMESKKSTTNPAALLARLDLLYGDRDREQKAIQALHHIRQGEYESFASFYPKFEREIANANAESWPDNSKMSYLRHALNDRLKQALVPVARLEVSTYTGLVTKCEELSNSMELLGQWKKPGSNRQQKDPVERPSQAEVRREEMMEWEPIPTQNTQVNAMRPRKNANGFPSKRPQDKSLLGKRAKWVDQTEIDSRLKEGRCLRCGRTDCRLATCPLAAPIRPGSQSKVNSVRSGHVVTEAAVEEDSDEEGMSPRAPDEQ
jgi:hypothetical protein